MIGVTSCSNKAKWSEKSWGNQVPDLPSLLDRTSGKLPAPVAELSRISPTCFFWFFSPLSPPFLPPGEGPGLIELEPAAFSATWLFATKLPLMNYGRLFTIWSPDSASSSLLLVCFSNPEKKERRHVGWGVNAMHKSYKLLCLTR